MTPFGVLAAQVAVLDRANVDTDQIIPARFLRKPRGPGYGLYLFHDEPALRAAVLGAGILVAGANFGCGSSREGAVYALVDAGVRCVIAPSFGDIFAGNAGKNGLLLLQPPNGLAMRHGQAATIDLPNQHIEVEGAAATFEIDAFRKRMLVEGLDDIGLTLALGPQIAAWVQQDAVARPWLLPDHGDRR